MSARNDAAAVTPPAGAQASELETAGALQVAAPQETRRFATIMAEQGLNLRAGPGREFPVLTVLDMGESVEILPLPQEMEVPGWTPASIYGTTGWLRTEFVQLLEE